MRFWFFRREYRPGSARIFQYRQRALPERYSLIVRYPITRPRHGRPGIAGSGQHGVVAWFSSNSNRVARFSRRTYPYIADPENRERACYRFDAPWAQHAAPMASLEVDSVWFAPSPRADNPRVPFLGGWCTFLSIGCHPLCQLQSRRMEDIESHCKMEVAAGAPLWWAVSTFL